MFILLALVYSFTILRILLYKAIKNKLFIFQVVELIESSFDICQI